MSTSPDQARCSHPVSDHNHSELRTLEPRLSFAATQAPSSRPASPGALFDFHNQPSQDARIDSKRSSSPSRPSDIPPPKVRRECSLVEFSQTAAFLTRHATLWLTRSCKPRIRPAPSLSPCGGWQSGKIWTITPRAAPEVQT